MGFNIHGGGDYVEVDPVELDQVNQEAADLAAELDIAERVEVFQKKPAFVNFKDTKSDFSTAATAAEVPVRLITPERKLACTKSTTLVHTPFAGGRMDILILTKISLKTWKHFYLHYGVYTYIGSYEQAPF